MKKIILASIFSVCAFTSICAQNFSSTAELKTTQPIIAPAMIMNHSGFVKEQIADSKLIGFKINSVSNFSGPIENAGLNLKRAGNYLLWGTTAGTIGQLFTIFGEPTAGLLFTVGGSILILCGYLEIADAGAQMQQSSNN